MSASGTFRFLGFGQIRLSHLLFWLPDQFNEVIAAIFNCLSSFCAQRWNNGSNFFVIDDVLHQLLANQNTFSLMHLIRIVNWRGNFYPEKLEAILKFANSAESDEPFGCFRIPLVRSKKKMAIGRIEVVVELNCTYETKDPVKMAISIFRNTTETIMK